MKSTDVEIEGTGILHVEDNCQVFSDNFLPLSTTSVYTNFTLTPGQVVVPELPNKLTEEDTQVLEGHQDQADWTLGALDALMARGLAAGQQGEMNLRNLLTEIHHQNELHHYHWLIAIITFIIITFDTMSHLQILETTYSIWYRGIRCDDLGLRLECPS